VSGGDGTGAAHIEVEDLVVKYGDAIAVRGVNFAVRRGEHVTLLGPSGCGKTTTLRSIAGLERPSSGAIRIGGRPMYDSEAGVNIPAEKRDISMVFQSYAVWPHMSVFDNVAYGLRVRKLPAPEIEAQVLKTLDLVQLRDFARRSASKLSGGQQQRVAVARAVAFSPNVLLFDEPLSNLDAKLRAEMRVELRELQQRLGVTSLYVTHDQEEALAISDRVIVMNVGGIEQIGTPEDIYNRPRTRFVADFVGSANLIPGRIRGANGTGRVAVEAAGTTLHAMAPAAPKDGTATLAIRTAYIDLSAGPVPGNENAVAGTIRRRMFHGDFVQYIVDWPPGQLIVRRPPTEFFEEGAPVTLSFAAQHCVVLED
jgi:ABC-type Fe3+/spermidine/putrescine transport system ATPase subunit